MDTAIDVREDGERLLERRKAARAQSAFGRRAEWWNRPKHDIGRRSTIQDNLKRAAAAGLAWLLADDVTDEVLGRRLFGLVGFATGQRRRAEPDWAALTRELKGLGATMMILWEEYRAINQDGYGYSRFCDLLRGFE